MVSLVEKIIYKVLAKKTPDEKKLERMKFITELMALAEQGDAREPKQYANNIANEFYLDSIIVSRKDGSVLMSTDGDSFQKAVKGSSMYEYANAEFPDTKMLLIKDGEKYNVIYPKDDLIYIFKTSGEISSLEAQRIAQKLGTGIDTFSLRGAKA